MSIIILLNKPYNVISQFSLGEHEISLAEYIKVPDFYPIGRLDKNSEGLLMLTNDGALQHRLSHPRYNKKKYYWVQVEGVPSEDDLMPLRKGLSLGSIQFLPAVVHPICEPAVWPRVPPIRERKSIPTSWLEIIIREGKNHQVRKMTAAIGFPTLRLIRHRIANWKLGGLLPGESCMLEE